jgi:hypothetical protein
MSTKETQSFLVDRLGKWKLQMKQSNENYIGKSG